MNQQKIPFRKLILALGAGTAVAISLLVATYAIGIGLAWCVGNCDASRASRNIKLIIFLCVMVLLYMGVVWNVCSTILERRASYYHILILLLVPTFLSALLFGIPYSIDSLGKAGLIYMEYQYKPSDYIKSGKYTTEYEGKRYKMLIGEYGLIDNDSFFLKIRDSGSSFIMVTPSTIYLDDQLTIKDGDNVKVFAEIEDKSYHHTAAFVQKLP